MWSILDMYPSLKIKKETATFKNTKVLNQNLSISWSVIFWLPFSSIWETTMEVSLSYIFLKSFRDAKPASQFLHTHQKNQPWEQ